MRKKIRSFLPSVNDKVTYYISLLDASLINIHHNYFFIFSKRNIFKKKKKETVFALLIPLSTHCSN